MKFIIETEAKKEYMQLPVANKIKTINFERKIVLLKNKNLDAFSLLEYEYTKENIGKIPTLTGPKIVGTKLVKYYDLKDIMTNNLKKYYISN